MVGEGSDPACHNIIHYFNICLNISVIVILGKFVQQPFTNLSILNK